MHPLAPAVDGSATPAPLPALRACLLSGGESRRMGRDKALLPHPEGGSWLERTLRLLTRLELPITLLSRHPRHLQLARALAQGGAVGLNPARLETISEPPPWDGPLRALHRLMELHADQRLLLCPVDMPSLTVEALRLLLSHAEAEPCRIHLAQGGERLQPLLAVLPSSEDRRQHLATALAGGERRLQHWLMQHPWRAVPLDPQALRNCNRPEQAAGLLGIPEEPGRAAGSVESDPIGPLDQDRGRCDLPRPRSGCSG